MCKFIKDIVTFDKTSDFTESEVFAKIKEMMDGTPNESASFALTTMIIDGLSGGGSISKVSKELKVDSEIPDSFAPY